jgi:ketosteroid isomerase-like protein
VIWYEEFYATVDAMDIDAAAQYLTADTTFRLGSKEETRGRDAVLEGMAHFWTMIGGISHTFVNVVESGNLAALEAVVEYTRLDDSKVSIPATTMVERRDGLVTAQRVYIDLAPLFGGADEAGAR